MKHIIKNREIQTVYVFLMMLMITLMGCENKTSIKVGFAGCLSGRLSDLGTAGRNGLMLAVEQVNEAGGINGRPVDLIIKDDKHDPDVAIQVDKELIEEGVVAIIGHMTSAMSVAAVPLINKEKMLMISPTTSTNELTGIDDYFLRICPESKTQTDQLASHAFNIMNLRKMAGVYDLSNRAFAEGLYKNFTSEFKKMGGTVVFTKTFTSGEEVSYLDLAKTLLASDPEGLFMIAGALDTAMICQQVRKFGSELPIISSAWAFTPDLIQHGGSAVEGLIFSESFYKESKHENYLKFKTQFSERFGKEPGFAETFSYEATQVLVTALLKINNVKQLKDTILKQQIFSGLQGDIRIDQYGDAKRKRFLITVKDGQFITME
jgi:branched-chain amino acid transport system substrate-binding protein